MAHNIAQDRTTGQHMVFTAGALPWHQLGQNVSEAQTWEQAIELAGLNWEVIKAPLHTQWARPDGSTYLLPVDDFNAIVRKDSKEHLGVVGKDYEIIQNQHAFDFTEAFLEVGASYESAGALGHGERIWTLARIPQADFTVGDKDRHETYLCFATSHDGSMAATVKLTTVRVVCQNTLTAALAGNGVSMKIRHTKSAAERLAAAQRMVSNTVQSAESLADKLKTLARRKLSRESLIAIVDKLFPATTTDTTKQSRRNNMLADILNTYARNDGDAFPEQRGTAYNLLNAITDHTDHARSARITSNRIGMTVEQARAENALFGTGEQLKTKAVEVIYQLTDGAEEVRTEYRPDADSPSNLLDQIVNRQN